MTPMKSSDLLNKQEFLNLFNILSQFEMRLDKCLYVAFGQIFRKLLEQVTLIKSELEFFMWASGAFKTEPRELYFTCWWKRGYWYQTNMHKCDISFRLGRNREQESMILKHRNNDKEKLQKQYQKLEKSPHLINIEV